MSKIINKLLIKLAVLTIFLIAISLIKPDETWAQGQFKCEAAGGVCNATYNGASGCETGYFANQNYCNASNGNLSACNNLPAQDCFPDPNYGGDGKPCRQGNICDSGKTCTGGICHVTPGTEGGACRTSLLVTPCDSPLACVSNICSTCQSGTGNGRDCTSGGTGTPGQSTPSSPGPWYNQNYSQWSSKVFDQTNPNEIFGERYTYAQVNWIINSLTAVLVGSNISDCVSKGNLADVGTCMQNLQVTVSSGGIVGLASLTNTILNAKPASGVGYVKDNLVRLNVIPQAYAQTGAGFTTLQPIVFLWKVLRDISYLLLVVVIIVMAFMIMFRVKISPQVVISVQSALPKIAIALILITFSYAIAGLLVDLSYVILGVFALAVKGIGLNTIVTGPAGSPGADPIALFSQLNSGNGLVSIIVGLIIFTILFLYSATLFLPVGAVVTVATGPLAPIVGGTLLASGIILLILVLIVFFIILRLLWLMIRTACVTVLLIIVGPIMILLGTVAPQAGFGRWVRLLAANLAVYPTVSIMLFLSHYFFWGWFMGGSVGQSILASCQSFSGTATTAFNTFCINTAGNTSGVNTISLPGMSLALPVIGLALSFIILFLVPRAAHIVQAMIEGKGFNFGGAVGEAFGPAQTFGLGALQSASSLQQQEYGIAEDALQKGRISTIDPQTQQRKTVMDVARALARGRIK